MIIPFLVVIKMRHRSNRCLAAHIDGLPAKTSARALSFDTMNKQCKKIASALCKREQMNLSAFPCPGTP
ncbi:hypothetical protein [Xylophilus ampelinus]|uniref:hypothetical protein n=1 Tax=Xylophilus ampelinus TaxID=54067 RepID=UPI0011B7B28A|nr:hypothetical protein [Xylophilus ampelinus]MCS4510594.1 hypothetical protein [Xylophilus ampelinus]